MRFNFAAGAVATALLVGNVYADEAQKVLADEGSSPADPKASSPVTPDMPTFTVSYCFPPSATYTPANGMHQFGLLVECRAMEVSANCYHSISLAS
jgi:hypothetical protein